MAFDGARSAPDPAVIRTVQEFTRGLRALKAWSGDPSLRLLERRTGLPRSTIADSLDPGRGRLPPLERVVTLLEALEIPPAETAAWVEAWRRIQAARCNQEPGMLVPDAAVPEAPVPEAPVPEAPVPETPLSGVPDPVVPAPDVPGSEVPARGVPEPDSPAGGVGAGLVRRGGLSRLLAPLVACLLLLATAADALPTGTPPGGSGRIALVARVAEAAQIRTDSAVALQVRHPVLAGDTLIVTLMLTSTDPGEVRITDTQADRYTIVADVTDDLHHRTLIAAAFAVKPLTLADLVTVEYPSASKHHVAVDEFRGIGAAGPSMTASGEAGGTFFSTGSTPLPCTPGELLVAAVGTNSGGSPAFPPGWSVRRELRLSTYRLNSAYRIVGTSRDCSLTGTTTAQWAVALVSFH